MMTSFFRWGAGLRLGLTLAMIAMIGLPMSAIAQTPTLLPTPTVLSPNINDRAIVEKPLFNGVTKNKTRVAVYIDGVYNGDADVKGHRSGTASWSYEPFLDLKPGTHEIRVRAVDPETKLQSEISLPVRFEVEAPLPAPVVLSTVVNKRSSSSQPFIVGVAPADTHLEIFIDGQLNGTTSVSLDESGVGSFSYQPFLVLDEGSHTVMARAIDDHGKRSEPSAVFAFQIREPAVAVVADETASETTKEETEEAVEEEKTPEEGEVLGETVTEEEETKANENSNVNAAVNGNANANSSNANANTNTSAAAGSTDSDSNNNSTIGWVILGLIVLALLWRGRKTLFGEGGGDRDIIKEQHRPSSSNQPPLWKSTEHGSSGSNGRDHSVKDDANRPTPPPPPPASSY